MFEDLDAFSSSHKPSLNHLMLKKNKSLLILSFIALYNRFVLYSPQGKIIFQYKICISINLLKLVKNYPLVNLQVKTIKHISKADKR